MGSYVVDLDEVDQTQTALVGGKGAQLGALLRIDGIAVPEGFCVTTDAFERIMAEAPSLDEQLDRLSSVSAEDPETLRAQSAEIRRTIGEVPIPEDLVADIVEAIERLGADRAYAVRSSATAEDLPTASFAGQHDTSLNVAGPDAILQHIRRCWASLFTERAVTYRARHGFDHRAVNMAVVVQRMVAPDASGIMFTADPVTSNRRVIAIEAALGLGEAFVSGLVNADSYQVRDGSIVASAIATKHVAICPRRGGGTDQQVVDSAQRSAPALTDAQVVRLAELGRRIEAYFGDAQDVEWSLSGDEFQFVQSRPITTLFPLPVVDDDQHRVYLSVGHAQMMTDAMKPLGISFWQLTTPRPMYVAGGRLFADVAPDLLTPTSRAARLALIGTSDPLTVDALRTILERDDFIPTLPDEAVDETPIGVGPAPVDIDPDLVTRLIERTQASITALSSEISGKTGPALLEFILEDIQELKRILFDPESRRVYMSAMEATGWLNAHLQEWLGEKNVADTLTQSVPNNITSEMGLALMDVADVIRPHAELVSFLERVDDDEFLDDLDVLPGGSEAHRALDGFLDTYGMRCVGEIDITRPRWRERPSALLPVILGNIRNFASGEGERRFERGRIEAWEKEQQVLARLRELPEGEAKAEETKAKIDLVRRFIGYREYPKYGMVSRYFIYKQALLEEARRLVAVQVIGDAEDLFFLTFEELQDLVRTNQVDGELIALRKEEFHSFAGLMPPRVMTSEGEVVSGRFRRDDVPAGALVGLAVSSGMIEGRARVIHDLAEADVWPGDILVTAYTDPSWSPLFVAIAGLVTEVGGLMTHGAVIAREYGLPAVVAIDRATRLIRDGQRIRVHGTEGYVELLD